MTAKRLALVTGGSTGIGRALAQIAAEDGYDLLIASDDAIIENPEELSRTGAEVQTVTVDLSTPEGVRELLQHLGDRTPDLLFANAGRGLGHAFIEQDLDDILHVIGTNVTGTTCLAHEIARRMATRGEGRILFTGSIAGYMPGTFQAVYNATKAYVDLFSVALRHELQGTGVSVTCLSPGPTDTRFFDRAEMTDTNVGQGPKDDAAKVARVGYDALMAGTEEVVSGWQNKLQAAAARVMPQSMMAETHRKMAEPGKE